MRILVITGGLGSGKSTAMEFFASRGAVVLSADDFARSVLRPGTRDFEHVVAAFGEGVIAADGSLDRAALASLAFESPETVKRLNAIVHPSVAREIKRVLSLLADSANPPDLVVVEVPLLAEVPVLVDLATHVLAICAPVEMRVARVLAKGMSEEDARRRIACQVEDDERVELATHVIVNDGDEESFFAALGECARSLKAVDTGGRR